MRFPYLILLVLALATTGVPAPLSANSNWILQQQRQQQMMNQQRMMQQQRDMQRQQQMQRQRQMEQQRRQQQAMQQRQQQMQQRQQQMQVQRQRAAEQRRVQQLQRQQELQRQQAQRQQVARTKATQDARVARDNALRLTRTKRLEELRQRTRIRTQQAESRKDAERTQALALMILRPANRATVTPPAVASRQAAVSTRLAALRDRAASGTTGRAPEDVKAAAAAKLQAFKDRKKAESAKPRDGEKVLLLTGPSKDRRNTPGVASHGSTLPRVKPGETWLKGNGTAGKIPLQVAERLTGRNFASFDQFRQAFWKEVHRDPALRRQFSADNQRRMSEGLAPHAVSSQQVGNRKVYELDHNQEIQKGGNVYDMNNIFIRSPLNHLKAK